MQVGSQKTMLWSMQAADRQDFRAAGFALMQSGRDLGGHMQFDHWRSSATVKSKILELDGLWGRLSRSLCSVGQKYKAARMCAWPRGFHSAAIVHLPGQCFQHQRSYLMWAVRFAASGPSALIQCSLFGQPLNDPAFWVHQNSVQLIRQHANPDVAAWTFPEAMQRDRLRLEPGPCGVLLLPCNRFTGITIKALLFGITKALALIWFRRQFNTLG